MSKITVEDRLARLLDTPSLPRLVPHLPPETLHQLIRHRGLEACGELVVAATPAQLTVLLDLDLWRHARPGRDHSFDADRFGEWLEVLVDTGETVAARTIAALDENLVVAGLSRYIRVFDAGIFEPTAQSDDEAPDRQEAMREGDTIQAGEAPVPDTSIALESEIGGYIVRGRRADTWDAIVTLLTALDIDHGGYFHAVMQGCRRLSNSRPEIDGLDDLLREPEQHLHDVAVERDRRQSQQGYATPADARAFLTMARQRKPSRSGAGTTTSDAVNPVVAAYFRATDDGSTTSSSDEMRRSSDRESSSASAAQAISLSSSAADESDNAPPTAGDAASLDALFELLTEAGVMPERPRALLDAADEDQQAAGLTQLRRMMAYLRDTHDTTYFTRSRELAFLANTLVAGCSVQSRPFTAREAADAAAAVCNLGLEHCAGSPAPEAWLNDHDLISAFEAGWTVLHHDVSLVAADQLIATLAAIDCVDPDIRYGLAALRRTLAKERDAGTPWRARGAAEVLAMLDTTAWIGVLGLLDECPVLAAALLAVVDGRTTAVSPTEFTFISTAAQIGEVRMFLRKLPRVLSS